MSQANSPAVVGETLVAQPDCVLSTEPMTFHHQFELKSLEIVDILFQILFFFFLTTLCKDSVAQNEM